jgi:acyl-CoA thioester hydrolase
MGVVYYANYFAFFEAARVELLRDLGLSYREFEERGAVAAVVEATCRYRAPAHFDDLLLIRTRLVDLKRASFAFEYEIVREEDGLLIALGRTSHACLDRQSLRPVGLPEDARRVLALRAETGSRLAV